MVGENDRILRQGEGILEHRHIHTASLAFFNGPAATNLRSPITYNTVTFTSSVAMKTVLEGREALASLPFAIAQL